ncbi:glutamyl-tRNA synthetase [Magnetococcus marinus MC-1]|uniref:Glutamate--tRNA ligase n=2 Tax=Magnetococcus TaxID=162171 RepID=SYE_MAGMM|nr:RecName: Full=Glutamate--tRNA ligase; AltName: Full=Glutamyl-tRNA synthetase; Short=GluRS [Magnetococcus marinus MC-1]ABK43462.1 glutamyl-tRNA synthetase [Magnetococcus marinus MC-1]
MRTRFAPSPTGFLHVGGARTALFCHLQARHVGGTTVLRIEDTDRERSNQALVDAILDGLHWLGLDPDEGPLFQSDHTQRHTDMALKLLEEGKAYKCYCTKQELDDMRAAQQARKEKPRYDGRCRHRSEPPSDQPYVIRFKTPLEGEVVWPDMVQGTIHIANKELDDLILLRSDGSPTYNLAVVVDDHDMEITHVIRGEDHTSNTPRQIHLFQALGWDVPSYAHIPLLHGEDGSKLSKRHGAVSVLQFREEGFLASALNNYLVRMGWSHGEKEEFTMDEMVALFDVNNVGRSAAIFNTSKLLWLNGVHIRQSGPEQLRGELMWHLQRLGVDNPNPNFIDQIIPGMQERVKTMLEMAQMAMFYFKAPTEYAETAVAKHLHADILPAYAALLEKLHTVTADEWDNGGLERAFKVVMAETGAKMGKIGQPVRIAISGSDIAPGIYDILQLVGRHESLRRLEVLLSFFQQRVHGANG